ncbi:imidazole glycerol phosphate synthase subunit HisF [Arcanobacterium ihumii]|uniref:imidazole glycerol phosphate synthase subunit HisF n=1 Tax=Arcanobacterium ihumii TaxID=2138162 RepID=UPI000F52C240|nr:imidazole glycerol phosphate synthase subunit HisF [Arcanobacterium ihumii]
MPVAIRVIPCLDVSHGRVVKGVNFENLRDAGDPVEMAALYGHMGCDELTFLDVSASVEGRSALLDAISATADQIFIPLTVGGGVREVSDVAQLLQAGADKVGINTGAVSRPDLIDEVADEFGNQVITLSVDARRVQAGRLTPSGYEVTTHGGKKGTGIDALNWAVNAVERGAGEILLNSMDADGTTAGFDISMIKDFRRELSVPIIASGGAGKVSDFVEAVQAGADAVLAASVFHYGVLTIADVKAGLSAAGIEVR